jgi:WD40 repeat protein/predicted Ser/Thr protein kinase
VSEVPFGDYVLEKEIAHGGMGVVYRARQLSLDRTVAIKLLLLGRHASQESLQRFRREAQSAAILRHPNIVAVHEVGQHDGQPFIAMEFVDGSNLADVVRPGPLPPCVAADHARTIAVAVQFAHAHGVIHRDLKPSNILVDPLGQLRLTDFGLAKRLDGGSDLTETGRLLGTPNYLAPEAASGRNHTVGPPGDIYAIGAIFYELLTGRPPFLAESIQETLLRIRDTDPVPPRALNRAIPVDAETICLKCLDRNPQQRYPTADALAEELRRFLEGKPILARPVTRAEKVLKWARRQPHLAAAAATILLVVVALITTLSVANVRIANANRITRLHAEENRRQLANLEAQTANHLAFDGDTFAALPWLVHALELAQGHPHEEDAHRRRIGTFLQGMPQLVQVGFHDAFAHGISFSPDGSRVLSHAEDHAVRIWKSEFHSQSGTQSTNLPVLVHQHSLLFARFTPDGRQVATLTSDSTLHFWDADRGTETVEPIALRPPGGVFDLNPTGPGIVAILTNGVRVASEPAHLPNGQFITDAEPITQVRYSPDGKFLCLATTDGRILLWDTASGRMRDTVIRVEDRPSVVIISADSRRIAAVIARVHARVWDATTGAPITPLLNHSSSVYSAHLNSNGTRLVTAEWNSAAHLWDVNTGSRIGGPLAHDGGVRLARFSPDDRSLVTAGWDTTVRLWDANTGAPTHAILHHAGFSLSAAFSPDSRLIATASQDTAVRVWRLPPHQHQRTLVHGSGLNVARYSSDQSTLLTPSWDGGAYLWNRETGSLRAKLPHPKGLSDARFALNDTHILTSCYDGVTRLWRFQPSPEVVFAVTNNSAIEALAMSPDGSAFLTMDDSGNARIWRTRDGQPITPPITYPAGILAGTFSPDASVVAMIDRNGNARIWNTTNGQPAGPVLAHPTRGYSVQFSHDGQSLLTSHGGDGTIACSAIVWNPRTGEQVGPPMPHLDGVFAATFSPDGRVIATAGEENAAFLWDAVTRRRLTPPLRHLGHVRHVAFSPDGLYLLTSSYDGTARVWEVATGEAIAPALRHRGGVVSSTWSADGHEVATASYDGTARLWNVAPTSMSLDTLRRQAELLSAHRLLHPSGLTPLTRAELGQRWIESTPAQSP